MPDLRLGGTDGRTATFVSIAARHILGAAGLDGGTDTLAELRAVGAVNVRLLSGGCPSIVPFVALRFDDDRRSAVIRCCMLTRQV